MADDPTSQPRLSRASPLRTQVQERLQAERLRAQQVALVELAKSETLHGGELAEAFRAITEIAARTISVGRASVWLFDEDHSAIRLMDLYDVEQARHSAGTVLFERNYPAYFQALETEEQAIAAHDAHTDPRTREYSESYLTPLGIGAMLDVPIRLKGRGAGVFCYEHVGGPRTWAPEEQSFAGSMATMVTLALDAYERRQAEESLRHSAQLYKNLVDRAGDIIYRADALGRFTVVNPTAARIMKCPEGQLVGRYYLELVRPDCREAVARFYGRQFVRKRGSSYLEFPAVAGDGTEVWFGQKAQLLIENEKVVGFEAVARDITERKQAEKALQRAYEELEWRVSERTAELARSQEQLRALAVHLELVREEERTRIARDIHDELGQALTALNMDLSWMRSRLPQSKPLAPLRDKALAMAGLITHTIESMRQIATELRPGVLDQLGLMAAMEWQTSVFQERYGIACRLVLPAGEVELNAQRSTALFRMLQEALTNVVRHAGATSVTITLDKTDAEVRMTVEDDGKGISEESAFPQRALGIVGMRERALALGGAVRIQGIPDNGTTVAVSLPLSGGLHDAEASMPRTDRG